MKRDTCAAALKARITPDTLVYCALGSSRRAWLAQQAGNLTYCNSDPMGMALPAALGLALAVPEWPVLFIGGDGDLVMSLGCLLTVAGAAPPNLRLVIFDNGRYETGGGQALAGSGRYALHEVARGAGFGWAERVERDEDADAAIARLLAQPGPAFLCVTIDQEASPYPPATALAQVEERVLFMQALAARRAG